MAIYTTKTLNLASYVTPLFKPPSIPKTNLSFSPPLSKPTLKISATFSPTPLFRSTRTTTLVSAVTVPAFLAGFETGSLNEPVTKLAVGIAKWLDLYAHVLTVRILLGWFPNIPWEKQPFSAVRSLCDPYLNLFRNMVPMNGTLDFSSIIGFMVLTTLSKILNTNAAPF